MTLISTIMAFIHNYGHVRFHSLVELIAVFTALSLNPLVHVLLIVIFHAFIHFYSLWPLDFQLLADVKARDNR